MDQHFSEAMDVLTQFCDAVCSVSKEQAESNFIRWNRKGITCGNGHLIMLEDQPEVDEFELGGGYIAYHSDYPDSKASIYLCFEDSKKYYYEM